MKIASPEWYERFGRHIVKEQKEVQTSILNWDSVKAQIFEQSFSDRGAHSSWIIKKWGEDIGIKSAEFLKDKGWIQLIGNSYFPVQQESIESDHSNNLSLIHAQLKSISIESCGEQSWYYNTLHTLPKKYCDMTKSNISQFNARQKEIIEEAKKSRLPKDELLVVNVFGYTRTIED